MLHFLDTLRGLHRVTRGNGTAMHTQSVEDLTVQSDARAATGVMPSDAPYDGFHPSSRNACCAQGELALAISRCGISPA